MTEISASPVRPHRENPFIAIPSASASEYAESIRTAMMRAGLTQEARPGVVASARSKSLEERLFDSRAAAKLRVASVAMHLSSAWRERFFAQVDALLNAEDWDRLDEPISEKSFATLLRLLLLLRVKRRPGLGATSDGHVVAMWTVGKNRLTIECLPGDEVRWAIVQYVDGDRDTAAGETALPRLLDRLGPYNPQQWFADEGTEASGQRSRRPLRPIQSTSEG
jgi:hypothetical protein